ncbi:hypothetical protein IHQ71_28440 [Rhizobium sp. TH2]|uniref:hypothetical protein n=1 Tax=Rhizobium sp. TH2 TaxID=2775403 RepID=UPI002158948F|nr:hypothetical protein [Rhizobium sp. TH2]UVC08993.1 hypothetical protein IHQ71_28440 [Rhizobium sp. TH2]
MKSSISTHVAMVAALGWVFAKKSVGMNALVGQPVIVLWDLHGAMLVSFLLAAGGYVGGMAMGLW